VPNNAQVRAKAMRFIFVVISIPLIIPEYVGCAVTVYNIIVSPIAVKSFCAIVLK